MAYVVIARKGADEAPFSHLVDWLDAAIGAAPGRDHDGHTTERVAPERPLEEK
jgi:hypothetical protein